MISYLFRFGWRVVAHPRIAALGFAEGNDDLGMTYDDDSYSPRSVAYDVGRTLRRGDWSG